MVMMLGINKHEKGKEMEKGKDVTQSVVIMTNKD